MKLFSRKALIAGATAVAVSFAGTTVATAEENPDQTPTAPALAEKTAPQALAVDPDQDKDKEEGSSTGDIETEDITAWIGVFTAVIGALGTLFGFLNKYFDFF
ncbi:hypothetical protein [Corynebacterium camporealensis]